MIQLRAEQMVAFQARYESGLVKRIANHVRIKHADIVAGIPDPLIEEMVQNGLVRARRYGLTWESNLIAFIALMFTIAPNFDEQPAIRRVLMRTDLPPDERFERLEHLRDRHWHDAQRRYDERAWFPELYAADSDDSNDNGIRIRRIRR